MLNDINDLEPDLMVDKFIEIALSIMAENIPNKLVTANDNDPPWITNETKTVIRSKHRVYSKYTRRSKQEDREKVRVLRNQTAHLIDNVKENYFKSLGRKLTDLNTELKALWRSINKLLNKKKFANIPSLLKNKFLLQMSGQKQLFLMISFSSIAPFWKMIKCCPYYFTELVSF